MSTLKIAQQVSYDGEDAHAYMHANWVSGGEGFSDLQAFDEAGDTELLADALVSAGAIDSKACYPEFSEMEAVVERIAARFRRKSAKAQQKQLNEAMAGTIVVSCSSCNHVQFPNEMDFACYETELRKSCWDCDADASALTIRAWGVK